MKGKKVTRNDNEQEEQQHENRSKITNEGKRWQKTNKPGSSKGKSQQKNK